MLLGHVQYGKGVGHNNSLTLDLVESLYRDTVAHRKAPT